MPADGLSQAVPFCCPFAGLPDRSEAHPPTLVQGRKSTVCGVCEHARINPKSPALNIRLYQRQFPFGIEWALLKYMRAELYIEIGTATALEGTQFAEREDEHGILLF